jgi:hypothetical protein
MSASWVCVQTDLDATVCSGQCSSGHCDCMEYPAGRQPPSAEVHLQARSIHPTPVYCSNWDCCSACLRSYMYCLGSHLVGHVKEGEVALVCHQGADLAPLLWGGVHPCGVVGARMQQEHTARGRGLQQAGKRDKGQHGVLRCPTAAIKPAMCRGMNGTQGDMNGRGGEGGCSKTRLRTLWCVLPQLGHYIQTSRVGPTWPAGELLGATAHSSCPLSAPASCLRYTGPFDLPPSPLRSTIPPPTGKCPPP